MVDQVAAASFWPVGDEVWLAMIEARLQQGANTLDDVVEVLAMFQTAEQDYLSIPLLQRHLEFLIERHAHFNSLESKPEDLGDTFSIEWTRRMISSVIEKGAGHLTKSHLLWDAYFDWAMEQLENARGEERSKLILEVEDLFLERLKQPHSTYEQTFQSFSTFTTNYKPADIYEKLLVAASKSRAPAVKAYERREKNESYLAQSSFSPEAYNSYLLYERRAKKIDLFVLATLYERAIADTAKRRFENVENAEVALRSFWSGYCDVMRLNSDNFEQQRSVLQRASRSVPGSGAIWAKYIRFLESTENDINALMQSVSEIYDEALSSGLVQTDIEEVVPLILARAGLIRRAILTNDEVEGGVELLLKVLEDGIAMVRAASHQGDPRYRLEKYLADIYVNLAESPDLASAVWQTTVKHYKSSYLAWTFYIEALIKEGKYDEVRSVYKDIVSKNLDWPEAIFDAWVAFEHLYGSLEDLQECLDRVERTQALVNLRRAKEAEKAVYRDSQAAIQADVAVTLISEAQQQATAMQLDTPAIADSSTMEAVDAASETSKKRKSEESGSKTETSKKPKTEKAEPSKRDRENNTIFVANLPSTVTEQDLVALFKDCGTIREVKITGLSDFHVATIEFTERESVLAGLTKDKKRIDGQEISVHLAWESTLYVANFPEKADDAYIRRLFGQFGVIFDVRWPSKKFKATRRFCYVQYTSPDAAQSALSLHGKELEPNLSINVFISNPERKKERTDAGADDREVYVAGLSKFVTKNDLEKLFKTYGSIKEVRMATDEAGHSKGFAFVEFEDESSSHRALQANNHDLKNRRIAVTLADSRVRARQKNETIASGLGRRTDLQNRSVRIRGLPSATQEGLLQQTLEKIVPVKRVEVFQESGEAVVELENAADAGRLLLLPERLQFGEKVLTISEELPEGMARRVTAPLSKTGEGMFVPRAAASRPRAGLGSTKAVQKSVKVQSARQTVGLPTLGVGKRQDDFRKLLG